MKFPLYKCSKFLLSYLPPHLPIQFYLLRLRCAPSMFTSSFLISIFHFFLLEKWKSVWAIFPTILKKSCEKFLKQNLWLRTIRDFFGLVLIPCWNKSLFHLKLWNWLCTTTPSLLPLRRMSKNHPLKEIYLKKQIFLQIFYMYIKYIK